MYEQAYYIKKLNTNTIDSEESTMHISSEKRSSVLNYKMPMVIRLGDLCGSGKNLVYSLNKMIKDYWNKSWLKGQFTQKWEFCHELLLVVLNLFVWLNTEQDVWINSRKQW